MARRSSNPRKFLTDAEAERVEAAIATAERRTSAEIKLVLVRHAWSDLRARAAGLFRKLGLDRTREHNGVMVMLVLANREFLVYGDEGVHRKVGQGFWDDVRDVMMRHFAADRFGEGLTEGIGFLSERLAAHFPPRSDDVDEIADAIAHED